MAANVERRIIIGMIVSTEYLQAIQSAYNLRYLKSSMAKRLASWCMEYFRKYNKAPGRDIEGIFFEKLKKGNMPKEVAEEIEEDILPGLSDEYAEEHKFNFQYLLDQTRTYFKERRVAIHIEDLQGMIDTGEVDQAETTAASFRLGADGVEEELDLSQPEVVEKEMQNAFNRELQNVITYPGALGDMWNNQLVRGGFFALMGKEKIGKTYQLLDLAIRAIRCKSNVAFFQAGDMTKGQQLKRIGVYLAKRSNMPKYCGKIYTPTLDCILHQIDYCEKKEREDCKAPFPDFVAVEEYCKNVSWDDLKGAVDRFDDSYTPCRNCREMIPTVWYKPITVREPLNAEVATRYTNKFFETYKKKFRLSTHPTRTLSVQMMRGLLDTWERKDGFVPDVIIVDYADIMAADRKDEHRHQVDQIWGGLRGLSQERHCLMVTATQADRASYRQNRIYITNVSEDKRKLAHVTAMYGLNQDKEGREKAMGLIRINELVVREDDFSSDNEVHVLQCLPIGRPFMGSFKRIIKKEG